MTDLKVKFLWDSKMKIVILEGGGIHNITRVLTSSERWHKVLFSQSALIPQLSLHSFQKLKYYTLGNEDYSTKLFWTTVAVSMRVRLKAL